MNFIKIQKCDLKKVTNKVISFNKNTMIKQETIYISTLHKLYWKSHTFL